MKGSEVTVYLCHKWLSTCVYAFSLFNGRVQRFIRTQCLCLRAGIWMERLQAEVAAVTMFSLSFYSSYFVIE